MMEENKHQIILADDHEIMLDGLSGLINSESNLSILALAKNGEELIDCVKNNLPDLCLVDLDMPKMDGLQAAEVLLRLFPDIKIIILTMHKERSLVKRMKRLGIKGYLIKTCDSDELIFAINKVLKGNSYFSNEIFSNSFLGDVDVSDIEKTSSLSTREHEIIRLLCDGDSNKKIADKLFISHKTVDTHRTNIMQKLDVHNIAELIHFCYRNNILDN